jgi:hypothetical protein
MGVHVGVEGMHVSVMSKGCRGIEDMHVHVAGKGC